MTEQDWQCIIEKHRESEPIRITRTSGPDFWRCGKAVCSVTSRDTDRYIRGVAEEMVDLMTQRLAKKTGVSGDWSAQLKAIKRLKRRSRQLKDVRNEITLYERKMLSGYGIDVNTFIPVLRRIAGGRARWSPPVWGGHKARLSHRRYLKSKGTT